MKLLFSAPEFFFFQNPPKTPCAVHLPLLQFAGFRVGFAPCLFALIMVIVRLQIFQLAHTVSKIDEHRQDKQCSLQCQYIIRCDTTYKNLFCARLRHHPHRIQFAYNRAKKHDPIMNQHRLRVCSLKPIPYQKPAHVYANHTEFARGTNSYSSTPSAIHEVQAISKKNNDVEDCVISQPSAACHHDHHHINHTVSSSDVCYGYDDIILAIHGV